MIDIEKVKAFRKQRDEQGYWSSEAFEYLTLHCREIEKDIELQRIIYPALTEVNEMFKDLDLEEE